jgi:hypothetical protein
MMNYEQMAFVILVDVIGHLISANKNLQDKNILAAVVSDIKAFEVKHRLWKIK